MSDQTREPAGPKPLRPRVAVYIGLTLAAALGVFLFSLESFRFPVDLVALVILCAMGTVSHALREPDVGSRVTFSFLSIILLACIPIVGPVGAAIVGGLAMGLETTRLPARARVFNFAMNVAVGAIGGLVYYTFGGARDIDSVTGVSDLVLHVGLPLMLADLAQMLANAALIAGIMRTDLDVPFRVVFLQMVSNSGLAYLGYGAIGFLFVVLWKPAGVGPFSAVLILAPLFVARWAFVQYGDELRAHESAMSALVTAVETKDPYAAGHSTRMAQLVEWFAEPLTLGVQELAALRYSAMLHDVGRVGLPSRIVRRPGDLGRDDLLVLAEHPELGVTLLRDMTFLADSLEGIRHHHERWDGRGYPSGLAGEEIPLASRVLAVADAFDALTTERPARAALSVAEAVAEIEARAGTQFDPRVVAALSRATERHGWRPHVVDNDTLAAMDGYVDHDDPGTSDLWAAVVADGDRQPAPPPPVVVVDLPEPSGWLDDRDGARVGER